MRNPSARIVGKQNWADYFLLRLESPIQAEAAQPGQFVMVRISDSTVPLLRRPLSIHAKQGPFLEVFFQTVGSGTALLAQKKAGDTLDVLGPLGNGFSLDNGLRGKKVAAVGGGRGIAPLYFLACELKDSGVDVSVFYGGKTSRALPLRRKFEAAGFSLDCSTDDGSYGFHGLVTELFFSKVEPSKPDFVFACGPDLMMQDLAGIVHRKKIPAEMSLESIMGCGFGACWGCVKKIQKEENVEWLKVCKEGPVFSTDTIIWD